MITDDIRHIINDSRTNAVHSVDFCRVQMYWRIGQRIVGKEQDGSFRALIQILYKEKRNIHESSRFICSRLMIK